jgi:hypothetical protein
VSMCLGKQMVISFSEPLRGHGARYTVTRASFSGYVLYR